jgi:hypothetical protein
VAFIARVTGVARQCVHHCRAQQRTTQE